MKTTHKNAIEIPMPIEHIYKIDFKNKNHIWRDAIHKDMINIVVAFELPLIGKKAP